METPPTTQGSGDKTTPTITMILSEKKKMFEDQQVVSGVPVSDHLSVTSKLSSKKIFGRKGGEYVCMCVCTVCMCLLCVCVSVCVYVLCVCQCCTDNRISSMIEKVADTDIVFI